MESLRLGVETSDEWEVVEHEHSFEWEDIGTSEQVDRSLA